MACGVTFCDKFIGHESPPPSTNPSQENLVDAMAKVSDSIVLRVRIRVKVRVRVRVRVRVWVWVRVRSPCR